MLSLAVQLLYSYIYICLDHQSGKWAQGKDQKARKRQKASGICQYTSNPEEEEHAEADDPEVLKGYLEWDKEVDYEHIFQDLEKVEIVNRPLLFPPYTDGKDHLHLTSTQFGMDLIETKMQIYISTFLTPLMRATDLQRNLTLSIREYLKVLWRKWQKLVSI